MTTSNHTTEPLYCVYRIVCFATGKVYIGQSMNVRERRREHFQRLKAGKHINTRLQKAYDKYGAQTFYFEVLEQHIPANNINERECYWIAHFNSFEDGFNLTPGGECGGMNGTECVWDSVRYRSISAAARATGIERTVLSRLLQQGYSSDKDWIRRSSTRKATQAKQATFDRSLFDNKSVSKPQSIRNRNTPLAERKDTLGFKRIR